MADGDLRIGGVEYDPQDLTLREERDVRKLIRDLVEDPDVDFESLPLGDVLPALCFVLRRRDDPDFTIEDALDLKQRDVLVDGETEKETRPTRRGASGKKTPGASGSPK